METNRTTMRSLRLATDTVCLLFLLLLAALAVIVPNEIPDATKLFLQLSLAGIAYLVLEWLRRNFVTGIWSSLLRIAEILALYSFLFQAVAGYHHLLVDGWMDEQLIALETRLLGFESSQALQHLAHPILTEAMMYAYVIYVPLLVLTPLLCFRTGGGEAVEEYLLDLVLAYTVSFLGFMVYPIASPLFYAPHLYTVPLEGGFFTWCGEWIRATQHYAGGSLPSPHCAAGTVILAALYRRNRAAFSLLLPTVILLYISTVYGRYHYAGDAVAGILTGLVVVHLRPTLCRVVDGFCVKLRVMSSRPDTLPVNPLLSEQEIRS